MPKKKTNDEFVVELKTKNSSVQPLEPYVNSATKIQFECKNCGHIWSATPAHLLHGEGCPVCAREKVALKRKYSDEVYSSKLKRIHPNIEVIGEYINSKTKIEVHCAICDNTWNVVPSSLLHGTGCPKCSKRYRRNTSEFKKELQTINPSISVVGDYKNAHTKIEVKCKRCGTVWFAEANSLLKGNDCPVCSHSQTSVAEQILFKAFALLIGIDSVTSRNKSAIGKELDVYIHDLHLAIEFGSWYWHSGRIENDVEKERLCEKAGIHLITILEGCPENEEIKGLKNVIRYEKNISNEKDFLTIQALLLELCNEYKLDHSIILEQWGNIVEGAKEESRKKDAESFAKELALIKPDIEYIGEYTGVKDPVYVLCKNCGTKWHASSAYDLLHGHGCPKCANEQRGLSQRMHPETFRAQVASINPHIELLEEYRGSKIPIRCRCKKCNTEWLAKPESIRYKKRNCPSCSPVTKKTNAVFLNDLSAVSKTIIPLEEYVNGSTKMRFKCDECGHEWAARPHDVLRGTGCPKCARRRKN